MKNKHRRKKEHKGKKRRYQGNSPDTRYIQKVEGEIYLTARGDAVLRTPELPEPLDVADGGPQASDGRVDQEAACMCVEFAASPHR